MSNENDKLTQGVTTSAPDTEVLDEPIDEIVDLEEYAQANRKPPRARHYRIRIDKKKYDVDVPGMTGHELLTLASKVPPSNYMVTQKLIGGQTRKIELDQRADFTTPGVERFMTLPLDQTEG